MNQNGESSRGGQIGHGRDHSYRSSLLLFLAASIWGVAFVAQSVGMDYMGPFTFNGARSLIGGTVLLPLIAFREQKQKKAETRKETAEERKQRRKITLIGGVCCGLAICTASMFQQIGIQYTTVGKAGFITTLYIIIVPIMGLFFGKKVRRIVWAGAAIAAAGMYLLCVNETLSLNRGDVLVFICAVIFSIHILVIDYFSPKTDGVKLSCIQFFVAGKRRSPCSLCRCYVLRRGLYPADNRAEALGSYRGLTDFKPGIRGVCSGRLGDSGGDAESEGNIRMCSCFCGGNPGAAAGEVRGGGAYVRG